MILYHAPSSYYSMIARLALLEAGVSFEQKPMDIHVAQEQNASWYVAINPNMTVPCLTDAGLRLTDSRDILAFAARAASNLWMDSEATIAAQIDDAVNAHYDVSIENLTFTRLMIQMWPLRIMFPRLLERINRNLEAGLASAADPEAVGKKIALNQKRIAFFTQGDMNKKMHNLREVVRDCLRGLPEPYPFLFGERVSSADIVFCVLLARLNMIGEKALYDDIAGLRQWFETMQAREAFQRADIWLSFQPMRIILRR